MLRCPRSDDGKGHGMCRDTAIGENLLLVMLVMLLLLLLLLLQICKCRLPSAP